MNDQVTSESALARLKAKINDTKLKLGELKEMLAPIGHPADTALQKRLDALKIEERALQRNYTELIHNPADETQRLQKVEMLLRYIEQEESSLAHEAAFLSQSAPSSVILAAEGATRAMEAMSRAFNKLLGGKRPLGESVFVNHSHDDLVNHYGLKEADETREDTEPPH
jgi:chromosome segregation ATPase